MRKRRILKKKRKPIRIRELVLTEVMFSLSALLVPIIFISIINKKHLFPSFHHKIWKIVSFCKKIETKDKLGMINLLFDGIETKDEVYNYLWDYDLSSNNKKDIAIKFLQFRKAIEKIILNKKEYYNEFDNVKIACYNLINAPIDFV